MRAVIALACALGAAFAACGGGSDNNANDPRVDQVGGEAELATYAYASAGTDALYDYLAPQVTAHCTKQQLAQALAGSPLPTGFKGIDSVKFDGDRATLTFTQFFKDQQQKVVWTWVPTATGQSSWRIIDLPGLSKCGAS